MKENRQKRNTDFIYIMHLYYKQIYRDRKQISNGQGMSWQWESGRGVEERDYKVAWENHWEWFFIMLMVSWGIYTYVKMCEVVCFKFVHLLYVDYTSKKLLNYAFWSCECYFLQHILFVGDKQWFFKWTPAIGHYRFVYVFSYENSSDE